MAAADPEEPCSDRTPRRVVLIVEDEILIRMLLSEALRHAGYDVVEAANADEALTVLEVSNAPDVLITDVKMPGAMDGFALAAHARQGKPGLKVIVTSGHAGPSAAVGVADAFIAKPYDLGRIIREVQALTAAP
jgi:CheY-like chemotaxis protein